MRIPDAVLSTAKSPRRLVPILAVIAILAVVCLWLMPNLPAPRLLETWPPADSGWEPWTPIFVGIDIRRANFSEPRPMKVHAVRIDLRAPGIETVVHTNPDGRSREVFSIYPSDFLKRNGLQVAVNAGSFTPEPYWQGVPVRLDNLGISGGHEFSPQANNLDSLLFLRDGRTALYRHGEPQTNHPFAMTAVGGMWINLLGGTNMHEPLAAEAASVAGLSSDRRYLYWLVVDGRQPGYSEGATPGESADLIRQIGASDALNMDGGSSVALVIDDGHGGFDLLNQPSHPFLTGVQRPIGGLIGFRARRLH